MPPIELESAPILPEIKINDGTRKSPRFDRRIQHLMDRMTELQNLGLDCDPIQVLMEIALGQKLVKKVGALGNERSDYELQPVVGGYDKQGNPMDVDASTRAKAASELCSYLYPKRKAVELTGVEGTAITFAVQHDNSPLPSMPGGNDIHELNIIDAEPLRIEDGTSDRFGNGTRDISTGQDGPADQDGTGDGTADSALADSIG